ncbi:hypothetical protein HYPSUDRAFT_277247 [Hypholoma sublateritium FD-334 SS-4]|uniref:Blue (type 1) copper domain-containing protein n=1 Tax=Hypholoma sublateritium (strain FD-334 SS-4) TaxID=945553 RepID=A0A0D2Q4L1_HYPSF|nr:hypothetical protein HYPSUDRAFT_277247 [Hypholoma sublateritium FD-334 SS-4]
MSPRILPPFLAVVGLFVAFAAGQTDHPVTVGQLGSFYDPPTLSAGLGDTVTFSFLGPFHTVTQSSAANPCLPLPGGFDSGVLGTGIDENTTETFSWTLTITNVSEPIYFFCQITTPTSHCGSGMVGIINPTSQEAYQIFRMSAEAVSGTPAPSPTLVLSGIGAAAKSGPFSVPASSTIFVQPITTTDFVTSTPTSGAQTSSSTKTHLGAIVGATVGGFFGLVILVATLVFCMRQRRSRAASVQSPVSDDSHFFRYNPAPARARRPSEAFVAAKALENSTVSAYPLPRTLSPDSTTALAPNRRRSTPPAPSSDGMSRPSQQQQQQQTLNRQVSVPSDIGSPTTEAASPVNMQALAHEVAAVLMRAPSGGTLNSALLSQTTDQSSHFRMDGRAPGIAHDPPAYRMATGAPGVTTTKVERDRG